MQQSKNRTFIVTGGNSGLGFQCVRFLSANPDAVVVIACRDVKAGQRAGARLGRADGDIRVLPLDLSAQSSVREFADKFRSAGLPPLAGIVCNAGGQNIGAPTRTAEGFESTFGVNHLAHYLLTRLLLPDLQPDGQIVFVSSSTHDPKEKTGMPEPRYLDAKSVANDLENGADAGRRRYTTSKLCNIYATYEYARRLASVSDPAMQSIRVNAFDPGLMPGTGLARTYPMSLRLIWNYVLPVLTLFHKNVNRPSTSGKRLASLVSAGMGRSSGKYYSGGHETPSSELSHDATRAKDLWDESADMTGLLRDLEAQQPTALSSRRVFA